MALTKATALWIYETMLRIRMFEEKAIELFQAGELPGFLHAYVGEEGIAAGVCAALKPEDHIISTHRGHGHVIAKGGNYRQMFAELYAKRTGYCKGKGGSMHIADLDIGMLGANGIVGAGVPIAAGAALAFKMKKTNQVVVSFFGDGASNQGAFHEGLNLASTWGLPVVYVCENNHFGESTPQAQHQKIRDIADRARAYDIPGAVVDGMDPVKVYEVALEAVGRARRGGGPTLIEAKSMRFYGHYVGDPGNLYGHDKVVGAWKKRDPVPRMLKLLRRRKWLSDAGNEELCRKIGADLEDGVQFGRESPEPAIEDALSDVYAKE
ncbi:MAG: thiamine pyrophosphate-dependent dehydrogenase E1 component subunit alpha [Nitrospinota bacterium]